MREIKFRAFHKARKEMYNVHGWHSEYMFKDTLDGVGSDGNPDKLEDVELMQYTGLKDKNGKEIYEGDIGRIASMSGRVEFFTVEWGVHRREMKSGWTVDIPSFAFVIDGFSTFPIVDNYLNGHDLDIIEVIGNIYESPELLTK